MTSKSFKDHVCKYHQMKGQSERLQEEQEEHIQQYRDELQYKLGYYDLYEIMDDWSDRELEEYRHDPDKKFRDLVNMYREFTYR